MSRLDEMIRSAPPSTPLQFRAKAYGPKGEQEFLRDLLAIANASVKGPRLIVVGVDGAASGRRFDGVNEGEFTRRPSFLELARHFIEPPISLSFQPVVFNETRLGVFQIGDCQDRPYMMRVDHSPGLCRGDAWIRVNDETFRMGRTQLQALFQSNFKDSIAPDRVEVGFAGNMSHKQLTLPVCDLDQLPSAAAAGKVRQMLDVKAGSQGTGNTTMLARLTHARLFGAGDPYQDQSEQTLNTELEEITQRHRLDDQNFLFGTNGNELQLTVFNHAETAVEDASFTLLLPNLPELFVADQPPEGQTDYPNVDIKDDTILITDHVGVIAPGAPVAVFKAPPRVCAGKGLLNQRATVGFTLFARNLRAPVRGRLSIDFRDQLQALMA